MFLCLLVAPSADNLDADLGVIGNLFLYAGVPSITGGFCMQDLGDFVSFPALHSHPWPVGRGHCGTEEMRHARKCESRGPAFEFLLIKFNKYAMSSAQQKRWEIVLGTLVAQANASRVSFGICLPSSCIDDGENKTEPGLMLQMLSLWYALGGRSMDLVQSTDFQPQLPQYLWHMRGCCKQSTTHSSSPFCGGSALERYYDEQQDGPMVWKSQHYFDVYEKHLARFRGSDVHVAEIGICGGGSLKMWRWYFGEAATIIGIDILNVVRVYRNNPKYGRPNRILIGDQNDSQFWRRFKQVVPRLDVVIEDGVHTAQGSWTPLQELVPHLTPGGVYIVEDILDSSAPLVNMVMQSYVHGMMRTKRSSGWEVGHIAEVSYYLSALAIERSPLRTLGLPAYAKGSERVIGGCWGPHRGNISEKMCCGQGENDAALRKLCWNEQVSPYAAPRNARSCCPANQ